jgi:hypothetical protein
MTQDEIIEMAEKAKLDKELADDYCRVEYWTATEDELVAFAKLVAAKATASEREACWDSVGIVLLGSDIELTKRVAAAIRARGQA